MRRRWGLASFLCVVSAASAALAQTSGGGVSASASTEAATPAQEVTYGAMPGGLHVASAEALPKGVMQVSTLSGYGMRKTLLGANHSMSRVLADIAFGYGITDMLSVALSLDGRYDKHTGLPSPDDGYVGDPHVNVRIGKAIGTLHAGAQLGVWVPGKDAPSIAGSAISVDGRALVSVAAGPSLLSLNVGFRLDNSAKSAENANMLSLQDRVSLGVSHYNAVLAGAHVMIPAGKAWIGLEGSLDMFLGSPPSGQADLAEGKMLLRAGASAGFHINDQWSVLAFVEGAKVPGVLASQVANNSIPLIPYEPSFTGGLGLQARFGGKQAPDIIKPCAVTNTCPEVSVDVFATITGTVVDANGKPLPGARVTTVFKNAQPAATQTDDKGEYTVKDVPIGKSVGGKVTLEETGVEVNVELDKMKPAKGTIAQVAQGNNTIPPITLEPMLPPGQLRGVVRALPGGRAVGDAAVTVTPGDLKVTTAADGTFALDLAPGTYKVTIKAKDLAPQELDVTIDPNGVAIKNIDLHK